MEFERRSRQTFAVWFLLLLFMMNENGCHGRWWAYSRVLSEKTSFQQKDNRICHFYNLNNEQLQACLNEPRLLLYVGEGSKAGVAACQQQFAYSRWNCSINVHKLYKRKTPESAYVNAISSAGVIYKISYECDRGKIKNCGCTFQDHKDSISKLTEFEETKEPYFLSQCTGHLKYGIKMTKIFLDPTKEETYFDKTRRSIKHLIALQNHKAARKILMGLSKKHKKCQCHGPTGQCVSKICYPWLPNIKILANQLYKQYQKALRVTLRSGYKLVSDEKRPLEKIDLVYTERFNYCDRIEELGIPGTQDRVCSNHKPREPDDMKSCRVFCCDRGYRETLVRRKRRCRCRFIWCCKVECDTCDEEVKMYKCR